MTVLEIVAFPLVAGTDESAFLAAAAATNGPIRAMPGFRRRSLCKGEDGSWTDVVEWADLASAKAAAAAFPGLPEAGPFASMIDFTQARMQHVTVAMSI